MAEIPNVSVIVPMYNVEKYISECLDSVLAQTMQNFELIVVDDCSTDNSYEIVESYIPKFKGKLYLLKLEKNTGRPSQPRNHGVKFSHGKYIFFLDNDDVITKTALEEMYNNAEKYQADVVYCEKRFISTGMGKDLIKNAELKGTDIAKNPEFVSEDLVSRAQEFFQGNIATPPWLKFVKRDFLTINDLKFESIFREDDLWTLEIFLFAKKFLRIPNACCIHRMRDDALTFPKDRPLDKHLRHWNDRSIVGLKILENFLNRIEFFRNHPEIRYAIINQWLTYDLQKSAFDCGNLPPHIIYELFKNEFKKEMGEHDVLISTLISNSIMLIKNLFAANQKIMELTPPPPIMDLQNTKSPNRKERRRKK